MPTINWTLPTLTSTYSNFVTDLNLKLDDLAIGLDLTTTPTSLPTGAIQWKATSNKWQKWNGSTWADLSNTYAINVNTATQWTTTRTIAMTGDVTYSTTINGSANVTGAATLATVNAAVGTYGSAAAVPQITVNAKGLITNVTLASLASMATQPSTGVTITGGTISGITSLNIPTGTASTTEGIVVWDVTNDKLTIGTGTVAKTFVDTDSTQTLSNKSFETQLAANSSTLPATTAYVTNAVSTKANLASPTFTGTVAAPTLTTLNNSTTVATTGYVNNFALTLRGEIPAAVNLDNYTTTGIYYQSQDTNILGGSNYPTTISGKLEVYANGLMIYQYYHVYNTTDIYVRSKYSTLAFIAWGKLAKTTDTVTASTSATNISGGLANRIPFQTAANTTSFIAAPTVANTALTWNGTALAWANPKASDIIGGATNNIVFQTAANTTGFVTAPTVANTALIWNGSGLAWGSTNAAVANGTMYENSQVISASYTVTFGRSAMSVGPITINSGVTVTVPSGSRWVVL